MLSMYCDDMSSSAHKYGDIGDKYFQAATDKAVWLRCIVAMAIATPNSLTFGPSGLEWACATSSKQVWDLITN